MNMKARLCKKTTHLKSGFLKNGDEDRRGFLFFIIKMATILFKISKIHCFFTTNLQSKTKHAGQDIEPKQNMVKTKKKANLR